MHFEQPVEQESILLVGCLVNNYMSQEKNIDQLITEYVTAHPEAFEQAALDVDALVNAATAAYDEAMKTIQHDVIHDPNPIENPEEEIRTRLAKKQEEIHADLVKKLEEYIQKFEKSA